jgi:hypothetical protein
MRFHKSVRVALCAAGLFIGSSASAVVLTFEGVNNTIYTAPIARSGYSIGNVAGDEQHFHEINSTAFSETVSNGTGILFNDRDTRIFMELTGGGTFTLGAFDASAVASNTGAGATSLSVSGYLAGNLVNSGSFTINGTSFSTFAGLSGTFDRILFDGIGSGGGFQLDNVTLNGAAVPEPSTWAMMLLGFGGIGIARGRGRRRYGMIASRAS